MGKYLCYYIAPWSNNKTKKRKSQRSTSSANSSKYCVIQRIWNKTILFKPTTVVNRLLKRFKEN